MIHTHLIRGLSLDIPSPGSSGDEPPILAGVFWRWQLWKLLELLLENPNVKGSLRVLCGLRPRRAAGRTLRDIIVDIAKWIIQSKSNTNFHFIVFLPPTLYLSVCSLSDRTTTSCPCRLSNLRPHLFQSLAWSLEWMEGLLLASRWVLTSLDVLQKSPDKVHKNHWEVLHNSFWAHTFME